ncbi:MAG TPA: hypothetical protein PLM74_01885 [Bacillota bacterium]|nr:hypothetical protein [Bacillota bacterium]
MRYKRNKGEWKPPGAPCDDTYGPNHRPDTPDIMEEMEEPAVLGGPIWLQRVLRPKSPLAVLLTLMAIGIAVMAYTEGDPRRVIRLSPPWQPGEISRLEAYDPDGNLLLTWELSVESQGSQVVFITDREAAGFRERALVFADPYTLIPRRTELERESGQGRVDYVAEYGSEDVTIQANLPRGHEEAAMKLPARPFYDDEQLIMIIRALPLYSSFRGTLKSVVTRAGAQDSVILRVRGRESISVPAGHFDTWKVEITGTYQSAWIAVAPPHQLVRYENRKTGILSELAEYMEGTVAPTEE